MQSHTSHATSQNWLKANQIKITLINEIYESNIYGFLSSPISPAKIIFLPSPQLENDQSWYWSPEWQRMEAEVDEDLRTGQYKDFDTIDEMISFLDSPK